MLSILTKVRVNGEGKGRSERRKGTKRKRKSLPELIWWIIILHFKTKLSSISEVNFAFPKEKFEYPLFYSFLSYFLFNPSSLSCKFRSLSLSLHLQTTWVENTGEGPQDWNLRENPNANHSTIPSSASAHTSAGYVVTSVDPGLASWLFHSMSIDLEQLPHIFLIWFPCLWNGNKKK